MMLSIVHLLAALALSVLSMPARAGNDLDQILSMLDHKIAAQCEVQGLMLQYEKTPDPAKQEALEQRMSELNRRMDDMDRGRNFNAMAQALSKAEQGKVRDHMIRIIQRCNATLPADAGIPLP